MPKCLGSYAKYTLELNRIKPVFDFDYDFYDNEFKCDFERKFIEHYYFHEIGFETVARFKHNLMAHLNKKMPYYTQLYKSEIASQNLDFLLNKDLKETFTRELSGSDSLTGSNTDTSTISGSGSDNSKISAISDGVSKASLEDGYLTGVTNNTSSNTATTNGSGTNKSDRINTQKEETTLISQGNIGVTSSAELLEKWRNIMINLDEIIIDECRNLFMGIM